MNSNIKFLGVDSTKVDLTEKKDATNNAIAEYYNLDDIRGYKVYTALLTQSGTDAPVATVLENTLSGNPTWIRIGTGQYKCVLAKEFTINKTFCYINGVNDGDTSALVGLGVLYPETEDEISCITISIGDTLQDSFLNKSMLEIRVYN